MQLLEGFVCEKGDPGVGDDPQDRGHEPPVKSLHAFLLGDPDKNMHDVAVPVQRKERPGEDWWAGNGRIFIH